MSSRRAAAAFFVVLCLVLCGLVLRRQVTAHPLPPVADRQEFSPMEHHDWRPAKDSISREAKATVQGQLDALHAGDGAKAMTFQSRRMRRFFNDPARFEEMIVAQYPEFGRCRSAEFGPVWSDQDGGHASALVTVLGENGHRAMGKYHLVREDGRLRIADVETRRLPN